MQNGIPINYSKYINFLFEKILLQYNNLRKYNKKVIDNISDNFPLIDILLLLSNMTLILWLLKNSFNFCSYGILKNVDPICLKYYIKNG